jgi:primary-amine oxidase
MPVTRVGFQLRPDGFFDGNPALDLPPAEHCHLQGRGPARFSPPSGRRSAFRSAWAAAGMATYTTAQALLAG